MTAVCSQQKLAKALTQVARLVPTRTELPILSNVLLKASAGFLSLHATNLQLSLAAKIPADVKEEGETTAPASALQGYISSLTSPNVEIGLVDRRLEVKTDKSQASFVTMDAVDYPSFPEKGKDAAFSFKVQELARLTRKVRFAASPDESRPALTGILVKTGQGQATLVATDGFRLSEAKGTTLKDVAENGQMLIPASAFAEAEKLFAGVGEEEVSVYLSADKNQALFDFSSLQLATRLLEAEYPDYEKILPTEFEVKASLDKDALLQAAKTAAIFAQKNGQTIYLNFEGEKITVEAKSAEIGEAHEEVAAKVKGGPLKISFNAGYLREGLEAMDGAEVTFEAKDALSPTRWSSPEDKSFFHILMPIRLEGEETK